MKRLALSLFAFCLAVGVGRAEDAESTSEKPTARLRAALRRAAGESLLIKGRVRNEKPEGGGMMGGTRIVIGGGGVGGKPYEGPINAARDKSGELIVTSRHAMPGFEIFFGEDDRRIVRSTYEDEAPSVSMLARELEVFLDLGRIERSLGETEFSVKHSDDGKLTLRGKAPRRLTPKGARGLAALGRSRVLRVDLRFDLAADGRLERAEFVVVRSDPTAGLLRRGGGTLTERDLEEMEGDETEGARTTYALTFKAGEPTARMKKFRAAVAEILEAEED